MSGDERMEEQLVRDRLEPDAPVRGDLRERLLAQRPGRHRPADLWLRAGLWAAAGIALLVVAALIAT